MNVESLSILAFFGIIMTLIIMDRKNIEFGIVLVRRTQKGKDRIKNFANKHKKFFNLFGNVSVVLAIILSLFGLVYLLKGVGVRLILPKVFTGEASESVQKVAFFMPLWYWVIGLFLVIIPHELFHGFLFAIEKIRIKSVGFLFFLIFPGGFVEPDEKQFLKSKPGTRMRAAAVGSIANFCIFLVLMVMSILVIKGFYSESGVYVFQINNTSYPAKQVNLTGIITEINGNKIRDVQDFENALNSTKPEDTIRIKTDGGIYNITLIEHPDIPGKSFLGVSIIKSNFLSRITGIDSNVYYDVKETYPNYQKSAINWFKGLIDWVALIDISVAVANLLPFLPFDGGIIWQALFEKITKREKLAKRMIKVLSIFIYCLLVLNLIGFGSILKLFSLI